MAKKSNVNKNEMNSVVKAEITGLILIAISVILFFNLGIFSRVVNAFFIFLIGNVIYLIYIYLFLSGIAIMIGRKTKIVGKVQKIAVFLLFLSIMVFISIFNINPDAKFLDYVSTLFSNVVDFAKTGDKVYFAGGLFGFSITEIFVTLISKTGTIILFSITTLVSLILFFQKPYRDYFNSGKEKINQAREKNSTKQDLKAKEREIEANKRIEERKRIDQANKNKQAILQDTASQKDLKIFNYENTVSNKQKEVEIEIEEPKEFSISTHEDSVTTLLSGNSITQDSDEAVSFDDKLTEELVTTQVTKVPVKNTGNYKLPTLQLLADNNSKPNTESQSLLKDKANLLVQTLSEFGVSSSVVAVHVGPTVTQFEIEIKAGTKLSKVRNLSGELALALAAKDVRIQAPIPQKSTVGIEIPNDSSSLVTLKEILSAIPKSETNKTVFGLGKDIMGKPIFSALNKMPHLLVAGATGSGKSVCINSIIISIAMRAKPDEVKMLMIDPKKVELSAYNGLPHLLAPVVTNPKKAAAALQKIVAEMERRYDLFSDSGSKNIESFNEKMEKQNLLQSKIPYIVVIVDELADLMMVASKEVEESIMRITQMARAAGIHLIVATQRPSTDVITGVIKSNIPSRIAFGVSSSIDSRTILDSMGAEKLLGKGDMLFVPMGVNHPIRIQGAYLSDEEVENVVHYCSQQQIAQFDENLVNLDEPAVGDGGSEDAMYSEVLEFVLENGSASTSLLQRRFRIGYNRASRLIDDLEANGIIGPQNGSKPREVITDQLR